jgi:pyruvate dehydrogenase complex dehydrogenase (E1) component
VATQEKQAHGGSLTRPGKGETMNPNGRPRKYVTTLTEMGYKRSEINDSIQAMMAMTMKELQETYENPMATILEKTIANAMKKSLEKGTLYSLETLLSRVYGQPKQEVSASITPQPIWQGVQLKVDTDNHSDQD